MKNNDLKIINKNIKQAKIKNKELLSVDSLFNRFHLFDSETCKLNSNGVFIKEELEKQGYQIILNEDRWNDGPDFVAYWGDPNGIEEITRFF